MNLIFGVCRSFSFLFMAISGSYYDRADLEMLPALLYLFTHLLVYPSDNY